jgi:hypothetical protein
VLAFRMGAWSIALPFLKRVLPLRRLVTLMWSDGEHVRSREREAQIVRLSGFLTRLRPGRRSNCLERSLLSYRYLSDAGAEPTIVIGVNAADARMGHAWVRLDGTPVHDDAENLEDFVALAEFGASGALVRSDGDARTLGRLHDWTSTP